MTGKNYTTGFAIWIYKYRWIVLILSIIAILGIGQVASKLTFDTSYRIWFHKDDPYLKDYDIFENTFGSDDAILIVFKEKKGIFTNKALESIKRLTDKLWKTTRIIRVDSLTNFQWTHGEEDDLLVEDLILSLPLSEEELSRKKTIALSEKMVNGLLLSPDATTSQIIAKLQIEEDPSDTHYMEVRRAVEKLLAEEESNTGYKYYIQGGPIIDTSFQIYSEKDMRTMIPLLFGLITLILFFLFRSLWGTLLPLLVVAFSVMVTMGFTPLLGIKLNPITASVPQIVLAIGIADSIHVITVFLRELKHGADRKEALIYTIERNLKPCFLTSLTTAIGFFSLTLGIIDPLKYLGIMAGGGTIAAFLITFSFLPSALAIVPFPAKLRTTDQTDKDGWTKKPADFVIAHPRGIMLFFLISAALIMVFLKDISINNNPILYFKKGTMIRDANAFIEKNLTGTDSLEFVIDSSQPDGIKDPAFLSDLEKLQNHLESLPQIAKTTSLVDIMKQINRSLHGENPEYYKLPETQELAAQYLFLYTLSLPLGKDLNDTINVDNSKTRMTAFVCNQSSSENLELIEGIKVWIRSNTPNLNVKVVGKTVMFSYMQITLTHSFVRSILLALSLVTLVMMFSFGSVKVGLLSMIPNTTATLFYRQSR